MRIKNNFRLCLSWISTALLACSLPVHAQFSNNWLIQRSTTGSPLQFDRIHITPGSHVVSSESNTPDFKERSGSNPIEDAVAFNSYYNTAGNLYFTVVYSQSEGIYFYDENRNLIDACTVPDDVPAKGYTGGSTEIIIVPVPGTCENLFHVWVGSRLFVLNYNSKTIDNDITQNLGGLLLDVGQSSGCINNYTPIEVYVPGKEYYYLYFLRGGSLGSGGSDLFLTRVKVSFFCDPMNNCGQGKTMEILDAKINEISSKFSLPNVACSMSGRLHSQLQISKDGQKLLFHSKNDIFVADLSTMGTSVAAWHYPIPDISLFAKYDISGMDFDASGDHIYFTVYDRNLSGSIAADALYRIDFDPLVQNPTVAIAGTAAYSRSQVRRAVDDNVYMLSATGIHRIDPAGTISGILLNTGTPETSKDIFQACTGATYNKLYILPDYAKGIVDAGFITGPVVIEKQTTTCFGGDAYLEANMASCTSALAFNWYENNILLQANTKNYDINFLTRSRVIDAVQENPFTCPNNTVTIRFPLYVPSPIVEVHNRMVCYGSDYEITLPVVPGMSYFGLYDPLTGTLASPPDMVLHNLTSGTDVYLAYGNGACIEKFIKYAISVTSAPTVEEQVHYVCPGGTVNINFADVCTGSVLEMDANGNIVINGNPFAGDPNVTYAPGSGISIHFPGGYKEVAIPCYKQYTYMDGGTITILFCLEKTILVKIHQSSVFPMSYTRTVCAPEQINLNEGVATDGAVILMPGFTIPGMPAAVCGWYDNTNAPLTGIINPTVKNPIFIKCVDQYGCSRQTRLDFNNQPSTTQDIYVNVICGQSLNPASIPANCSNGIWYTAPVKSAATQFHLGTPLYSNTILHGFSGGVSGGPCCYVRLHVNIIKAPPVTVIIECPTLIDVTLPSVFCSGAFSVDGTSHNLPYTFPILTVTKTYNVVCIDANGCEHSYIYRIGAECPLLAPKPETTNVSVYPQPAQSLLNIRINATPQSPAAGMPQGNALWKFKVYDLTGRLLLEEDRREVPGQTYSLDVSRIKGTAQALILVVQDEAAQIIFNEPVLFYPE